MDIEKYILAHFHYHPDGTITRDDRKGGTGSYDKDGYLILKIKSRQFKAHRVAWLLNYGTFPSTELDHINRIRTDNRIENLRECTRRQQVFNTNIAPNHETGVRGVYIDRTKGLKKKYTTKIEGVTYRFYTVEAAERFRKEMLNGYI